MKRLIPAYRYPAPDDTQWNDWIYGGTKGDIIIVNPASGPGDYGTMDYVRMIDLAQEAGNIVVGYVPLTYGFRPPLDVVQDMEKYLQWYGIDGWFLDETPPGEEARRYVALIGRWGLVGREGRRPKTMVFNPGTTPWWGLPAEVPGSIWVTIEKEYTEFPSPVPMIAPARQACILHTVPSDRVISNIEYMLKTSGFGFGYATYDTLPNPYDGEP